MFLPDRHPLRNIWRTCTDWQLNIPFTLRPYTVATRSTRSAFHFVSNCRALRNSRAHDTSINLDTAVTTNRWCAHCTPGAIVQPGGSRNPYGLLYRAAQLLAATGPTITVDGHNEHDTAFDFAAVCETATQHAQLGPVCRAAVTYTRERLEPCGDDLRTQLLTTLTLRAAAEHLNLDSAARTQLDHTRWWEPVDLTAPEFDNTDIDTLREHATRVDHTTHLAYTPHGTPGRCWLWPHHHIPGGGTAILAPAVIVDGSCIHIPADSTTVDDLPVICAIAVDHNMSNTDDLTQIADIATRLRA
jgi:hypothetical protein